MVLRLIRALPGEAAFLAPVVREQAPAGSARVAAPGPHDFAVRCERFVRWLCLSMILVGKPVPSFPESCEHLTPQRPSPPAPTCRDDRDTSPVWHRMAGYLLPIYVIVKRTISVFRIRQVTYARCRHFPACEIPMLSRFGSACSSTSTAAEEDGPGALFRRAGDSPTLPIAAGVRLRGSNEADSSRCEMGGTVPLGGCRAAGIPSRRLLVR